jgi:hypothetical protein
MIPRSRFSDKTLVEIAVSVYPWGFLEEKEHHMTESPGIPVAETPILTADTTKCGPKALPCVAPPPDHLQFGPSNKLLSIDSLAGELRCTRGKALSFIRALGIPQLRIRNQRYVSLWALEFTLFALLRPGGPGFQAPNCSGWDKGPEWRSLPADWAGNLCKDEALRWQMDLASVLYSGTAREVLEARLKALGSWLAALRYTDRNKGGRPRSR